MLNVMVQVSVLWCSMISLTHDTKQDYFTNDQYQELVDPDKLEYSQRKENSIFFEVRAMQPYPKNNN